MFELIKVDYVYMRIAGPMDLLPGLQAALTVYAPNYRFNPKYKAGIWDGKIRMMKGTKTPIGLKNIVVEYLDALNYPYTVDPELDIDGDVDADLYNKLRDEDLQTEWNLNEHQRIGALEALKHKRGVLLHCTSAGKTATCWSIINYLMKVKGKTKILMIVPKISLVEQSVKDFIEYGFSPDDVGRFYGEVKEPDKKIIVST